MYRPSHRLLRWLRLVLASLTLVGTGAMAQPPARPVAAAVQAGGSTTVHSAPELVRYARHLAGPAPFIIAPVGGTEPRAPEPPRRTARRFLLHRSLLH
ncbi:hypothetical protein LXT21_28805 [Myxococcus sp. K38C18041901]|uniref:hypothetical protein n=1 Tax=Myxococcus guangdongensis TaxID=2906760 RepID=UPI0020A78396|nr:hypothetical protein [Myxococcus guangdongensis]MCP3062793.1 hypothetical protein [Myxococcus guangdongensis]